MNTADFYQDRLRDHYHHPRNYGQLEQPSITTGQYNPSCGDSVSLQLIVQDEVITAIAFTGQGCVISLATASLLTEYCKGKKLSEIMALSASFIDTLIGFTLGPTRLKCALLAVQAVQEGIQKYQDEQNLIS